MPNANNKQAAYICMVLSHNNAHHLHGRSVYSVCETGCVHLSTEGGVKTPAMDTVSLQSNKREADTRIACLLWQLLQQTQLQVFGFQTPMLWFCYFHMPTEFNCHC